MRLWTRVKNWLPAVAWACLISGLSTDAFSSEHTSRLIIPILHWMFPHASTDTLEVLHAVIRKSAHFTEYAILGALLFRAFRADAPIRWRLRWAVYSFVAAGSWALLDEFHQTLTRTRGGSVWDVLLDSSGALCMLITIAVISRNSSNPIRP